MKTTQTTSSYYISPQPNKDRDCIRNGSCPYVLVNPLFFCSLNWESLLTKAYLASLESMHMVRERLLMQMEVTTMKIYELKDTIEPQNNPQLSPESNILQFDAWLVTNFEGMQSKSCSSSTEVLQTQKLITTLETEDQDLILQQAPQITYGEISPTSNTTYILITFVLDSCQRVYTAKKNSMIIYSTRSSWSNHN